MIEPLTPKHFTTQLGRYHFDFVEDEDGSIYAWGHRDPEQLLDVVFLYDQNTQVAGEAERGSAASVQHVWAVRLPDEDDQWWIQWMDDTNTLFTEATEGAFAVTVWIR